MVIPNIVLGAKLNIGLTLFINGLLATFLQTRNGFVLVVRRKPGYGVKQCTQVFQHIRP